MTKRSYELETVRCNLCGSDDYSVLFHAYDPYVDLVREPYRVVRCKSCGLGYLNPRIPERDIGDFYPEDIYLLKDDEAGKTGLVGRLERSYLLHGMRYQVERSLEWAERLGVKAGSVFDVGCGPGDRLALYRDKGMKAAGLELSSDADYARKRYGLDVFRGTLEQYISAGERHGAYGMVICYNVLEHMFDPLGSLKLFGELMEPGGMVVLMVPNLDSVQARLFRGRWAFSTEVPRHTYFFDRDTLGAMLEKAGFELRGFTTESNFWHPPSIVLSLLPSLDPRFNWRQEKGRGTAAMALARRAVWGAATLFLSLPAYIESACGMGALLTAYAVKRG